MTLAAIQRKVLNEITIYTSQTFFCFLASMIEAAAEGAINFCSNCDEAETNVS